MEIDGVFSLVGPVCNFHVLSVVSVDLADERGQVVDAGQRVESRKQVLDIFFVLFVLGKDHVVACLLLAQQDLDLVL